MKEKPHMDEVYELFKNYIPEGATLSIEETDGKLIERYIFRLTYTSSKSGRKMSMRCKGDRLPTKDDGLLHFYLNQIVLSPREVSRKFSQLYFFEKRARQDAFLFGGGNTRGNSTTVSTHCEDRLGFKDYGGVGL